MPIMKEARAMGVLVKTIHPKIHCILFKDNTGAVEMVQVPKMRLRTKHINVKYHHFRGSVAQKEVSIHQVDTEDQVADMLTKPLGTFLFEKHWQQLMKW